MDVTPDYTSWSNEQLVKRVTELEAQLKKRNEAFSSHNLPTHTKPTSRASSPPRPAKKEKKAAPRAFDPSKYQTRFVAFKFAYLGQRYNGFEHAANNPTPLPTIEEELWKAFMKVRLIFPEGMDGLKEGEISWKGCEYSKCGRTDRGVSAFGQVIALRVRSNKPVSKPKKEVDNIADNADTAAAGDEASTQTSEEDEMEETPWDPINDELPYIQLLNRVLPEDIRILAWCPDPRADFSARFSCRERRYRYFFTQPAYAPVPGDRGMSTTASGKPLRDGFLDIEAMQDAAQRLKGSHDFRNFCKIDPGKQITNFNREIYHAAITRVDPRTGPAGYVGHSQFAPDGSPSNSNGVGSHTDMGGPPTVYTFDVNGSAFLWHQVRHLVAVLFLVGQGLEPPSVVSDLLDVEKTPTRPRYEMATDAPLVLWDCLFWKDRDPDRKPIIHWIYIGDDGGRENNKRPDLDGGDGKFGRNGVMEMLWALWRQRKIDEVLAGSLMDVVAQQGRTTSLPADTSDPRSRSVRVYDGSNTPHPVGKYIPVMKKDRMEHFDVVNARYLERKGLPPKTSADAPVDPDE
ncbi:hypothetical protein MBLNU457_4369t1 [Dothideomycetes sp. NU457]